MQEAGKEGAAISKQTLAIALVAIALVVPVVAGQARGKPPKPPGCTPCTFEGEADSSDAPVSVGRDVATSGPTDQALDIHESLLPSSSDEFPEAVEALRIGGADADGFFGPDCRQIRLLYGRIDYWFGTTAGCGRNITATYPCRFCLIVVDGIAVYERIGKARTLVRIAFNDGRYLLDYRPCDPAVDPVSCYFKLFGCYDDRDCPGVPPGGPGYVFATFDVRFQ